MKSFLCYVGISWLIGLCSLCVTRFEFVASCYRTLQPGWFVLPLVLASAFAGLMLWLYPVFLASRRSLRHAGLAVAIASFGVGVLWSVLMA